ncbi:17612_t:CDS:2, partial [Cetraspora pellucida]
DDNEISDYKSDNARNETFLEALQSLRPEVFEKLIETDNNQSLQNKQELSFDENTEFLSNEYEELLSNKNDEFLSNENNEFSSDTDTELLSKENNKLLSDVNTELSSKEDNEHSFYMNDDKFSLEALDSLLKENLSDIRLRTVSQFFYLVKDHKYTKMSASELLAHSVNRSLWHAQVILCKFVEDEAIPALGIEEKKTISIKTAQIWLHSLAIYEGDDINQVISLRLLLNVPEIVPVTHDELIFYTNNGTIGRLCLSQEEKEANNLLSNNKYLPYTNAAGHLCIFYSKYHCELNYIESFWGAAKQYACLHCDYSFKGLKKTVPYALKSHDLSGKAAVFAVKKYRSHCQVPE